MTPDVLALLVSAGALVAALAALAVHARSAFLVRRLERRVKDLEALAFYYVNEDLARRRGYEKEEDAPPPVGSYFC